MPGIGMSTEKRCIDCGYILTGLEGIPDRRCPECGREFDLGNPATYATRPPFVRWRFWLPPFVLAFAVGLALYALLIATTGIGVSVTLALPLLLGIFLGFGVRVRKIVLVLLAITLLGSIVLGLYSMSFVGVYCGLVLGGVSLGQIVVGALMGAFLRTRLKRSEWDQRLHFPGVLLLLLVSCALVESILYEPYGPETVRTMKLIPADSSRVWDTLMFYEEVPQRPPLIMRIALPHPLFAFGSTAHVGDVKTCVYSKGRLVKQVTQRVPGERLAFNVIEQTHIENRSIRLIDGSFDFQSVSPGETRVTLTSRYQPLLGPRWIWRPFEEYGVHTLHDHVLEGMRIKSMPPEPALDKSAAAAQTP